MSNLTDSMKESRLIVLVVDADSDSLPHLQSELPPAADGNTRPVWGWTRNKGLCPIAPPQAGNLGIEPGASRRNASRALVSFQRLGQEAILMIYGADEITASDAMVSALKDQTSDQRIECWVVLVSHGGDLSRLFRRVPGRPEDYLLDLRRGGRAAAAHTPKGAPRKLKLQDVNQLEDFDTEEWTDYLNALPVEVLKEVCDSRIYLQSVARVKALREDLKNIFVRKDDVIDLMTYCSVAHLPMLLLGTWGTGKSMLVRQMARGLGIEPAYRRINSEDEFVARLAIEAEQLDDNDYSAQVRLADDLLHEDRKTRYFEYLVTRFTTPEELLGPVNVKVLLRHALHLRQTRSLMPRAEIVFLDEVFKANSSILNALLSVINERLFYNAGIPWSINLTMLFAASNEPPQEADLGAFYDRFPVRALCDPVEAAILKELLKAAHAHEVLSLVSKGETVTADTLKKWLKPEHAESVLSRNANASQFDAAELLDISEEIAAADKRLRLQKRRISKVACVNDFRLLRKVCLHEFGGFQTDADDDSRQFAETYLRLFSHLRDEYDVSDRSCGHFYRLARARALLDSKSAPPKLRPEDCCVLRYCGKDPEAARRLPSIVDGYLS